MKNAYKVRCVGYTQNIEKYFTIGKVYDVVNNTITNDNGFTYNHLKGEQGCPDCDVIDSFLSHWYKFERVGDAPQKIVITTDGKTTLARLYDGKTVVKAAEAVCSPSDTFDFNVGAKLAMERLTGETETDSEKKKLPAVGDFVRVKFDKRSNPENCCHFLTEGQILRVNEVLDNGFIRVDGYCFNSRQIAAQFMRSEEYEIL